MCGLVLRLGSKEWLTRIHVQRALSVSTAQAQKSGDHSPNLQYLLRSEADPPPHLPTLTPKSGSDDSRCHQPKPVVRGTQGGDRGTGQEGL